MTPIEAYQSLKRRTGGIQGCLLQEETSGIWTGEMVSRMALQDVRNASGEVQMTMMAPISENVLVVGSRADALAALEEVRKADGGGYVILSPSGYPMIKGMGWGLDGKPRFHAPDGGWQHTDESPA